jgi:preprotein translocase subunit SecG
MTWIGALLLIIHVAVCSALILIVLLQAGKGASLGASFGGGSSQTVFGARSASFIGRMTYALFAIFLATSLLLTIISPWRDRTGAPKNILQEESVPPPSGSANTGQAAPDDALSGEVTPPAGTQATPAPEAPEAGAVSQSETKTPAAAPTEKPKAEAAQPPAPAKARQK